MTNRNSADHTSTEKGLAALTYIAFNWDDNRERANANLEPLFQEYSMSEIEYGAMHALALIILTNAYIAGQDVRGYIDTLRPIIDRSLQSETGKQ